MADEKLNTGPGEEKFPEAPAPVTVDEPQAPAPEQTAAPTPQQEGPAQPEPGDVVVSFDKRCTFNGFCKAVLRNEAIDAIRERKYRKKHEVTFSDLSPQEENQLYTCDKYFVNDEAEKSFFVAGKEITAKQLADALHSLPEEKRQAVLLYYFFDMKDAEIAELMKIPRSTVQFRRTSSFELLKRFLEESR